MNTPIQSKINWTALVIAMFGIAVAFGFIPKAAESHINTIITIMLPALIVVFRTWYTGPVE